MIYSLFGVKSHGKQIGYLGWVLFDGLRAVQMIFTFSVCKAGSLKVYEIMCLVGQNKLKP